MGWFSKLGFFGSWDSKGGRALGNGENSGENYTYSNTYTSVTTVSPECDISTFIRPNSIKVIFIIKY